MCQLIIAGWIMSGKKALKCSFLEKLPSSLNGSFSPQFEHKSSSALFSESLSKTHLIFFRKFSILLGDYALKMIKPNFLEKIQLSNKSHYYPKCGPKSSHALFSESTLRIFLKFCTVGRLSLEKKWLNTIFG